MKKRLKFLEVLCLAGAIGGFAGMIAGYAAKNKPLELSGMGIDIVSIYFSDRLYKKRRERELYEQARREFNGAYLGLN